MTKVFRASRGGIGACRSADAPTAVTDRPADDAGEGDYLNCPFTKDEYRAFHAAIVAAEKAAVHDFDNTKFFEGCLPIEVMAHRGVDTLRFGPMKPAGLDRSAHGPLAVRRRAAAAGQPRRRSLQPRRISDAAQVGRTGARAADDSRPRAGRVRALRHDPPQHVHQRADRARRDTWQTRTRADLFFAGQVSGVEGYVESAASGLIAGRNAARLRAGPRRRSRRRARRRSARSATTSRTPIRGTTSRRTSRSASCRRSTTPPKSTPGTAAGDERARARGPRRRGVGVASTPSR